MWTALEALFVVVMGVPHVLVRPHHQGRMIRQLRQGSRVACTRENGGPRTGLYSTRRMQWE
jgi:hypothetical protein